MSLAEEVQANLLREWNVANFAEGMHGHDGHEPTLLNWRIVRVLDFGEGHVIAHLNVPSGTVDRSEIKLLSWRIMTLNTGRFADLQAATVITLDEQLAEVTRRRDLPRVPGLGTA